MNEGNYSILQSHNYRYWGKTEFVCTDTRESTCIENN